MGLIRNSRGSRVKMNYYMSQKNLMPIAMDKKYRYSGSANYPDYPDYRPQDLMESRIGTCKRRYAGDYFGEVNPTISLYEDASCQM